MEYKDKIDTRYSRICKRCGITFYKREVTSIKEWNKHYLYCSRKCQRNLSRKCLICGTSFTPRGKKRLKTAKYCSYICARQGQVNWKGGISRENNPSKFHFGQRQRIWKRDKRKCQICGISKKDMIVHHKTFRKALTKDKNLILLCRVCHMHIHALENSFRKR